MNWKFHRRVVSGAFVIVCICISQVLPLDPAARRAFVTTGGLRKMQELLNTLPETSDATTVLREHIELINQCFPDDVVK